MSILARLRGPRGRTLAAALVVAGARAMASAREPQEAPEAPSSTTRPTNPSEDVPGEPGIDNPSAVPDDETLERNQAIVGEIRIEAGDIFDPDAPGENRMIFRWADKIHRTTRDNVIRRQLVFKTGDVYSRRALQESARILRRSGYLYDAWIRPVSYVDNRVDIEVKTRDVWTLKGGFGFGRSGGVNKTRFGIHDSNFLGLGKELKLRRTSDVDRTEDLYSYTDASLLGTHGRLDLAYSSNSDGQHEEIGLERPFFSLEARWAAGVRTLMDDRVESIYSLGSIADRFRHRKSFLEAYAGFSRGLVGGRTRRWSAGFTLDQNRFEGTADAATSGPFPPDRKLAYPWIGFDSSQEGFIEVHNLDKISRTEDLNLSKEFHARLGWASPSFGADRSRAVFGSSFQIGGSPGPAQMMVFSWETSGRWGTGGAENLTSGAGVRYYRRDLGGRVFYASMRAEEAVKLDLEKQILLGGDNGLRGYPLRFTSGDQSLLLTLEERFYSQRHLFKLFRIGGAVFFDAGRAWFRGDESMEGVGLLRDIGVGLRIGSSRSARAAMIHVDVAVPLDGDRLSRRTQLLVTTGDTF